MNDYQLMESVIRYLDQRVDAQPDLNTMAAYFGMHPTLLHKKFHAWVGVTPKAFLQCLSMNKARQSLQQGESVLQASFQAGLSGPGRLHDLCCRLESASPGEIKNAGQDWLIRYAIVDTPFAQALLADGPRGLCHISFVLDEPHQAALSRLMQMWHRASFVCDRPHIENLAQQIFPQQTETRVRDQYQPLRAWVNGSAFQVKVWRALLRVPLGQVLSYKQLAAVIGHPGASRAVGTAMAKNPLAFLIPCHRVIRETGAVGQYHWGSTRKRCMLAWEQAHAATSPSLSLMRRNSSS